MRMIATPVLLGVCLLGPGCSFVSIIKRNIVHEPQLAFDEKVILERHERLGRLAWDEMVRQYGCQFSCDYRDGFIDGFVDYLTYGGYSLDGSSEKAVVPPVPPPKYRRAKAMSPEGLHAAEEWIMGFRHGSTTAMASGLRQLVTVPIFDKPNPELENVPGRFQSMAGRNPDATAPTGPAPEGDTLPAPRPVPADEAKPKPAEPAGPAVPPGNPAVPPAPPANPPAIPPG
jgi:hypothetical protein